MKEEAKKKWSKPKLVVLVRGGVEGKRCCNFVKAEMQLPTAARAQIFMRAGWCRLPIAESATLSTFHSPLFSLELNLEKIARKG